MEIKNSIALVTGANRGIGEQYVKTLLKSDATKIYAAGRDLDALASIRALEKNRVEAVKLDITKSEDIKKATRKCHDANLLINNAGVNFNTPLIGIDILDNARIEMETNYFGTLSMCRAFAPILGGNGGGAIINMLSILARVSIPMMGSLCASKAAGLSMTQGIRGELAAQGTVVIAVMPGAVDTRMSKDFQGPKMSPEDVAKAVLKAVIEETEEIYPGDMASEVAGGLEKNAKAVEKEFAKFLPQ